MSRQWRKWKNNLFFVSCGTVSCVSVLVLAYLLYSIFAQGLEHLDASFVREFASRKPDKAGMYAAISGSIWVCTICALTALPIGVGTAVYLEEFQPKHSFFKKLHAFFELNVRNLAGVPSIVYGILGLTLFVNFFGLFDNMSDSLFSIGDRNNWYHFKIPFGRSVLAGGLTLMLVVLPVIVITTQEALRAIPKSLREATLASGSTKWQVVSKTTLPLALPGIMTGSILAISRAVGEAAPLLVIAGIVYIRFVPQHLMDDFTVMPLQIYNWAGRPQEDFHAVAASGIIVLLAILLFFNALAIFIRAKFQKQLG